MCLGLVMMRERTFKISKMVHQTPSLRARRLERQLLWLDVLVPEIRRRKGWFWAYLLVSSFLYSHFKNTVARTAHLRELFGERAWRVTPRSQDQPTATPGS